MFTEINVPFMCFEGTSKRTNERKKAHIMGNVKWLCNVWKRCLRDDDDYDEESRREVKRTAVWIDRQEERIKMTRNFFLSLRFPLTLQTA